jgi:hypothetical protein
MSALSSRVLALPSLAFALPSLAFALPSLAFALTLGGMPAPALAATPPVAEVQPTEEESEEEEEESDRHPQGLVIRGFGRTGTVGLPGVGMGGGLSVGYLRNRFRVDLLGAGQLNRTQFYPGGMAGGDFSLWRVGLRACAVFGSGKISTPICGGADTGMMTATGVGVDTPRTERRPWSSVFADVDMVWHVRPRLGLVVTSRALVPLVRQAFYVGDRGTLVTTSPFGVEIGLGLELILL